MKSNKNYRIAIILMSIPSIVALMSFFYIDFKVGGKYQRETSKIRSRMIEQFHQELDARDEMISKVVISMEEIDKNLELIRNKEALIGLETTENDPFKEKTHRIVHDIQAINSLLDLNRQKMNELEQILSGKRVKIDALEEKMASMNSNMISQEFKIAEMKRVLSDKDYQLADLNKTLENVEEEIRSYDKELEMQKNKVHSAFFVEGTVKELRDKGIVKKEGGFLGIAGANVLNANVDESEFIRIDTRLHKDLPVYAKKAELLTPHPENSYKWNENVDEVTTLEIVDPVEFWKTSSYAVVAVK